MGAIPKRQQRPVMKILSFVIAVTFFITTIMPSQYAQAQMLALPAPSAIVTVTPGFTPTLIKGMTVHPDNPFNFDFIVDTGDTGIRGDALKAESTKLIKYFLASLTIPDYEAWVNLSPYEEDRIIPESFSKTTMGRDLLVLDYLLKQLSASLSHPEKQLGKEFWNRVRAKAQDQFGPDADIPMNTFNKVWIVPEKALVYEHDNSAFVVRKHLKVMMEEDYVALQHNIGETRYGLDSRTAEKAETVSSISAEIVKEILIPEIEKEVNEGTTFANLRQIYNSVILASWYKKVLHNSILSQIYVNQNKVNGVNVEDESYRQEIYDRYVQAFKTGVYDLIQEDIDPATQEVVPREYFSGGIFVGATVVAPGADVLEVITDQNRMTPEERNTVAKPTNTFIIEETSVPAGKVQEGAQDEASTFRKDDAMSTRKDAWMTELKSFTLEKIAEMDPLLNAFMGARLDALMRSGNPDYHQYFEIYHKASDALKLDPHDWITALVGNTEALGEYQGEFTDLTMPLWEPVRERLWLLNQGNKNALLRAVRSKATSILNQYGSKGKGTRTHVTRFVDDLSAALLQKRDTEMGTKEEIVAEIQSFMLEAVAKSDPELNKLVEDRLETTSISAGRNPEELGRYQGAFKILAKDLWDSVQKKIAAMDADDQARLVKMLAVKLVLAAPINSNMRLAVAQEVLPFEFDETLFVIGRDDTAMAVAGKGEIFSRISEFVVKENGKFIMFSKVLDEIFPQMPEKEKSEIEAQVREGTFGLESEGVYSLLRGDVLYVIGFSELEKREKMSKMLSQIQKEEYAQVRQAIEVTFGATAGSWLEPGVAAQLREERRFDQMVSAFFDLGKESPFAGGTYLLNEILDARFPHYSKKMLEEFVAGMTHPENRKSLEAAGFALKGTPEEGYTITIPDTAMAVAGKGDTGKTLVAREKKTGGINLNPELIDMEIKRDGKGIILPVEEQPVFNMKIEGLFPVIINVTPVQNMLLLLGFADTPEDTDAGYDYGVSPFGMKEEDAELSEAAVL